MGAIIFGVIIFTMGVALSIWSSLDEEHLEGRGWIGGLLFAVGIVFIVLGLAGNQPTQRSLKENTVEIRVDVTTSNGVEVSRDTVYVFTPKKK